MLVYLNGSFLSASAAHVPADDAGLLRGEGLFETLRACCGRVFRLNCHLQRLRTSADALGLDWPASADSLPQALSRLLRDNRLQDARCRITLTAGGTCLATAEPFVPYAENLYHDGAAVTVSSSIIDQHSPLAGHKVTSYFGNMFELRKARDAGFVDALRFNAAGQLAEGCVSNVFLIIGGRLATPPLSSGCLPGITRQIVLEMAAGQGIDAQELNLTRQHLLQADEIFITNTLMGIMPVTRLEQQPVAAGRPGALTRKMAAIYETLLDEE